MQAEARPGGIRTFADRLAVMRTLAVELDEPVTTLEEHGREFARNLNLMDLGVKRVLRTVREQPELRSEVGDFFEAIRGMAAEGKDALTKLEAMSESAAPLETASREARPVIRRMRDAISLVAEGRQLLDQWTTAIDELEVPAEG